MLCKLIPVLFFTAITSLQLHAQDNVPIKFGHVSPTDFDTSKLTVSTSKGAVIIAEMGYSSFQGNNNGWFSIVYDHKTRILVTGKNGIELANIQVPLYISGDRKEQLGSVKGITYNLENGKVVETKLKNDAIFEDKHDKNHILEKFTMPEVKEGSIIEYSYTITSDFLFNFQPWKFQGEFPKEWSEYEVEIPEYFEYVFFAQGYLPFFIKTESNSRNSYIIRYSENAGSERTIPLSGYTTSKRWVMKDVPAMKKEEFTTTIDNYVSKVELQLSGIKIPDQPYRNIMGSWVTTADQLLKEEDFGEGISKNNGWLNDEMKIITAGATNDIDKARKIYYYVRNNIKSTGKHTWWLDEGKSLKDIFKNKNGSVGEINLLLIAMLRHENINADPVILSTRDNGFTQPIYPLLRKYNYLICKTAIDTNTFYLDATKSYLGFGRLPAYCYNGPARVIDKVATPVVFSADTLREEKSTNVFLFADSAAAGKWAGNMVLNLNYIESEKVRSKIADKGVDDYKRDEQPSSSEDFSLSDITIKNLDDCENPLEIDCNVAVTEDSANDIIYFNPMIKNPFKENPLKSMDRKYPVEMPSTVDDTYTLYMEIPNGYEVDELPKSAKVTFNDMDGLFEYYISKDESKVSLKSHLKFTKATFLPEDYQNLRDFFDFVVKKNNEQIVFKKKK